MAIGPWDPMAAAAASRGRLLASDAEREQVIDALKAAFTAGLLTRDELDTQAAQALASRTFAELTAVTASLAGRRPPPEPVRAHRKRISKKVVIPGACLIVLLPALGAAFLTFYGGFIILFLVACIGAVVSGAPQRPQQPGPLPSAGRR
jgi:Domain of unknown function (DUF1707)